MQEKVYTCTKDDENQRLDYILGTLFPRLGLRARKRLCEQELVCVNGKIASASKKLRENSIISVNVEVTVPREGTDENTSLLVSQCARHSDLDFLGGIVPPKPPSQQFFVNFAYKKLQNLRFPKGVSPFGGEFERQSLSNRNDVSQCAKNLQFLILHQTDTFAAIHKPAFVHSAHIKGQAYSASSIQDFKDAFFNYFKHAISSHVTSNFLEKIFEKLDILKNSTPILDMESLLPLLFPNQKPILLNRLDFATSGILMVALSKEFFFQWKALQNTADTKKYYLALVEGEFFTEAHTLLPICIQGKILLKKSQKVRVDTSVAGERMTKVTPIAYAQYHDNSVCSLVLCEITKGTRHQIRAHLASIGHPLVGDIKYGAKHVYNYNELQKIFFFSHNMCTKHNTLTKHNTPTKFDISCKNHIDENTQLCSFSPYLQENKNLLSSSANTTANLVATHKICTEEMSKSYMRNQNKETFLLHHVQINFPDFQARALPAFWHALSADIRNIILEYVS